MKNPCAEQRHWENFQNMNDDDYDMAISIEAIKSSYLVSVAATDEHGANEFWEFRISEVNIGSRYS